MIYFKDRVPTIRSGLFAKRYEISHILAAGARGELIRKLQYLLHNYKSEEEIVATTYFEPALSFEPDQKCIVRFRQRAPISSKINISKLSKIWRLSGPGNLEIKIREKDRRKVKKMATFLSGSSRNDIYTLLRLARSTDNSRRLTKFIFKANELQKKRIKENINSSLSLINSKVLLKVADYLTPEATRVNLRQTFTSPNSEEIKITLDYASTFYGYPIDHLMFGKKKNNKNYVGLFAEHSNRIKMDIKTVNKKDGKEIERKLSNTLKGHIIHTEKYANMLYPNMVLTASKQKKTLVNETANKEVEGKANILGHVDLLPLIQKIRSKLIGRIDLPYRIFITNHEIKSRGDEELNRVIVGWRDKNKGWHEVVTIIRLNKKGRTNHNYSSILKWKGDPYKRTSSVLNREEAKEYLPNSISNRKLLQLASKKVNKKLQIVGSFKKIKHRIIVQDKQGRNYVVSFDKSISKVGNYLQQLEVEYGSTVVIGKTFKTKETVEKSCEKCLKFFTIMLNDFEVKTQKTNLRKIDFIGTLGA